MSDHRRILRFVAVGGTSALVHMVLVRVIVEWWAIHPLWANVAAWAIAFWVSFTGHHYLTFGDREVGRRDAAPRFLLLSLLGLAANESLYAALLHWTGLHYMAALIITQIVVAVGTYLLSHAWAFKAR